MGPNPFRAHDVIGAKGANFLTWSCLHHLAEKYGALFRPTPELDERQVTGQDWYPLNHFRPLVDWPLDAAAEEEFNQWIQGALFQMASLLLHEQRGHLSHINAIGELCAQFRRGILAMIRSLGAEAAIRDGRGVSPAVPRGGRRAAGIRPCSSSWTAPSGSSCTSTPSTTGTVGVITISRESLQLRRGRRTEPGHRLAPGRRDRQGDS